MCYVWQPEKCDCPAHRVAAWAVAASGGEGLMSEVQRPSSGRRRGGRDGAVGRGHRRGRHFGPACRLPVVRQQVAEMFCWRHRQARQHVLQVRQRLGTQALAYYRQLFELEPSREGLYRRGTHSEEAKPGILRRSLPDGHFLAALPRKHVQLANAPAALNVQINVQAECHRNQACNTCKPPKLAAMTGGQGK